MEQQKQVVKLGRVLTFAGAFIAFLIGGGFATGQEILQYFALFGYEGFLVGLGVLVLFFYVGADFIATGYREQFEKGADIFKYYCGKYIGGFYDYFTLVFVFLSYVGMLTAAGATLNAQYGLASWIGSAVMMVLAAGTVLGGLKGIVEIIGKIGPLIVLIAVGIGAYGMITNFDGIAESAKLINDGTYDQVIADSRIGNGLDWYFSVFSYVGFCMLWLVAFLAAMGKGANSIKEARLGAFGGSFGFVLGCVVLMLGLLAYLPEVVGTSVPSLILATKISPAFATAYAIIIMAGIYTTAVPLLWQPSARFTKEKTKGFYMVTCILAVVGLIISLFLDFSTFVNLVYGISGYIGFALIAFIIIKNVRNVMAAKK